MAVDRRSFSVGLTVLALAAVLGVAGLYWLRVDPDLGSLSRWIEIPGVSKRSTDVATAPAKRRQPHLSEEDRLLADIERIPRAADYRYAYALYLYREGRLDEASAQLSEVFKLKSEHPAAGKLHTHINDLHATPDPAERRAKRAQFAMETVDLALSELKDVVRELASDGVESERDHPMAEDRVSRLESLDTRYGVTAYGWAWVPSHEEARRAAIIERLEMHGKAKEADAMHREQIRAYPNSPDSIRAYLTFLINQGEFELAEGELAAALEQFPAYPELLIVRDGLAEISAKQDPMAQSRARMKLATALSDAAVLRMGAARDSVATN